MIELDLMPPDWKFAQNHAKANKPGLVDDILNSTSSNVFCPCCLKPIIKSEVPLLDNSKTLEFMGFGFPLYFIFIKYCIVLLLILICSYSAISLYLGIIQTEEFCSGRLRLLGGSGSSPTTCTSVFIEMSRIEPTVTGQEILIRVTSFFIHMLALLYIRDNTNKTMEYYNERTTSLSDFSLIIKNLPLREGIQKSIKDFIHIHFRGKWEQMKLSNFRPQFQQDNKVAQITLLPQIQDYYKLLNQKNQVIQEKRKLIKEYDQLQKVLNSNPSPQTLSLETVSVIKSKIRNTNEKINLINQNISEISVQSRKLAKNDVLLSEIAIVTFTSEIFKAQVLEFAESNTLDSQTVGLYFGEFQSEIQIEKAPEPSEIVWINTNVSKKKILLSKFLGWLFTWIFIAIVTIGFYFLLIIKTKFLLSAIQVQSTTDDSVTTTQYKMAVFLVFFDILLIVLFNKLVMGAVLHYFTHKQYHFSTADQEFSFALKYTLGLFFTTALMTLAVEAITFHNFYSHEFGVVEEESIMFIVNAFLIPIIWLINPWQIFTRIVRKLKINSKYFTQREANQIMSDTPYSIGKRYAEIVETMWFTYLYATLIPVGAFFTVVGLSLYYWIDKYNLLRRSSLVSNISGDMAVVSLKLLDFTLVLRPIGELIFDSQIRKSVQLESIILAVIAGIYFALPMDRILQFFHRQDFAPQDKSFDDVKDMFLETYQTMHPILSFKAVKIFQNLRKKSTTQITLNEIEITHAELSQQMSPYGKSGYKYEYMNSKSKLPQFLEQKSVGKESPDMQAEQEFLNYQSRSKKNKTASKEYFSLARHPSKQFQKMPPYFVR